MSEKREELEEIFTSIRRKSLHSKIEFLMNRGGIVGVTLDGDTYTTETLDQMPQNRRREVYDWLRDAYYQDIRVRTLRDRNGIFEPAKSGSLSSRIGFLMANNGIAEVTLDKRSTYTPETLDQMPLNQRRGVYDWLYHAQDNGIRVSSSTER